ncbi:MAG: metallophosphoesterase [Paludibacteraceae bacterium]|nr:metallophosphoesterase [Paludibacteraceae bacterium]MCK9615963.1 metallophosphoesterase [Candidatus Omnitrophota bacterium]
MKRHVIGDTHFYHERIIALCDRHPKNRKERFFDSEEMNEYMISCWNQHVGENDEVIHVGDFALCRYYDQLQAVFKRLNGRISLILGNHDCHSKLTKERLYRLGFERIEKKEIILPDIKIIFTHKPIQNPDTDWFNIHGHIHEKKSLFPNQFNVSVERNDYCPFLLQDIIDSVVKPYFMKGITHA